MKASIYDQDVLDGVATTFLQTEDIIENDRINSVTSTDWDFIMDKDVVSYVASIPNPAEQ